MIEIVTRAGKGSPLTNAEVDANFTNLKTAADAAQADATQALSAAAGKVSKDGDTMTGALTLPGTDPTDANHAARKAYVDSQRDTRLSLSGGTLTGNLTISTPAPIFVMNGPATANRRIDFRTNGVRRWSIMASNAAENGNNSGSPLVIEALDDNGNTIGNALSIDRATTAATFGAIPILPATNPTDANHAARKAYVDERTTFTQDGAGAVARDVAAKLADLAFTPEDFGAVGDGVADDTAALQAAINAAGPSGGVVRLGPKTYRHTGLVLPDRHVQLVGSGRSFYTSGARGTRLVYAGSPTGHWLVVRGHSCVVRDLWLGKDGVLALSGGDAVRVEGGPGVAEINLVNLRIESCWNGIYVSGANGTLIERVNISDAAGAYNIRVTSELARTDIFRVHNVTCSRAGSEPSQTTDGLVVEGAAHSTFVTEGTFLKCRYGVRVVAANGELPTFVRFLMTATENCALDGYALEAARNAYVMKGYASINNRHGIRLGPDCEGIIEIDGMDVRANNRNGILLECTKARVYVVGSNRVCNNSQEEPNTYNGLTLQPNIKGLVVIGGRFGGDIAGDPDGTPLKQRHGISIAPGCDNYTIIGADLRGNVNGPLFEALGATERHIVNCLGVKRENHGTVTGATPNTNGVVLIPHGCQGTPTYANVMLLGDLPGFGVEVQSLGSVNITARVFDQATGADVTTGTFDIMWYAKV